MISRVALVVARGVVIIFVYLGVMVPHLACYYGNGRKHHPEYRMVET